MPESFSAWERLIEDWMHGARDHEVERILALVRDELRRRGHEPPCQRKAET